MLQNSGCHSVSGGSSGRVVVVVVVVVAVVVMVVVVKLVVVVVGVIVVVEEVGDNDTCSRSRIGAYSVIMVRSEYCSCGRSDGNGSASSSG